MASEISITITNLPQIKAAFGLAPGLMATKMNDAIKKSVLNIQRKSMINTPVATGRLRASTSSQFEPMKGTVGTHTNYDVFVHEGTRYMKGRPYLRDAVNESEDETAKFFTQGLDEVLSAIGKKT